jgi:hypothetical protein
MPISAIDRLFENAHLLCCAPGDKCSHTNQYAALAVLARLAAGHFESACNIFSILKNEESCSGSIWIAALSQESCDSVTYYT